MECSPSGNPEQLVGTITGLLGDIRSGRNDAIEELFTLVYDDLRHIARRRLNGKGGILLQTTELVSAASERLLGRVLLDAEDRRHFYFLVGRAIHDVFVEEIRAKNALKRGGGHQRVPLIEIEVDGVTSQIEFLDIHEALEELGKQDQAAADIVRLRFFGGLTLEESAAIMVCSFSTARKHWEYAKAWLHNRLSDLAESM